MMDFGPALRLLRQGLDDETGPILRRPSSLTWIQWMHAAGKRVRGTKALVAPEDGQRDASASIDGGPPGAMNAVGGRKRSNAAPPPPPIEMTDAGERAAVLDAVVGGEHGRCVFSPHLLMSPQSPHISHISHVFSFLISSRISPHLPISPHISHTSHASHASHVSAYALVAPTFRLAAPPRVTSSRSICSTCATYAIASRSQDVAARSL